MRGHQSTAIALSAKLRIWRLVEICWTIQQGKFMTVQSCQIFSCKMFELVQQHGGEQRAVCELSRGDG